MDSIFSPDSALMRGLSRIADVMTLNLLFIATAIPLVTLGAALTALNFTAMRIATGKCHNVTGDYMRSFRQNFRQASVVLFVIAGLTAVFAAWHMVLTSMSFGAVADLILLAIWYVLAFNFATTVLFVFPYLASFEGSTRAVLRNARLLSWKHPFTAIGALIVIALALGVTVFYPQATGYGLAWLIIGFGGIAVVNGVLFARVFNTYIAAAQAAENQASPPNA